MIEVPKNFLTNCSEMMALCPQSGGCRGSAGPHCAWMGQSHLLLLCGLDGSQHDPVRLCFLFALIPWMSLFELICWIQRNLNNFTELTAGKFSTVRQAIFNGSSGLQAMIAHWGKKATFCHVQVNWSTLWNHQFIIMINNKALWAMELQSKTNLWKLLSKWLWLMWFAFGQLMNQKLNVWNDINHYSFSKDNGICTLAEPIYSRQV